MAVLTNINFKGFDIKSYVNFNNFSVQKQGEGENKLFTITANLFFYTENQEYFLESKPLSFTTPTLEGLTTKSIYDKIKEVYPGEDC